MSCPVPGISMDDEIRATELLLKSGARILEINAVRRHISATNGGRLAQRIERLGAEMINLILSTASAPGRRRTRKSRSSFSEPPSHRMARPSRTRERSLGSMASTSECPLRSAIILKRKTRTGRHPKTWGHPSATSSSSGRRMPVRPPGKQRQCEVCRELS